jgi:hypothetical protein
MILAIAASAIAHPCLAQSAEKWDPAGRAAGAFTGRVVFSPSRITFESGKSLPLAAAGSTRFATDMGTSVSANVYKVTKPDALPPYGGNPLCDGKRWRSFLYGAARDRGVTCAKWSHSPVLTSSSAPRTIAGALPMT